MGTIFIEKKNLDNHDLGWSTELLIFILQIVNGMLLMEGEKEAMDGNKIVYFDLFPERNYKEGSAAQTHFRLAESQFYRLISGTGIR